MDRDSTMYKIRRKIQTIAYNIVPNDKLSALYFFIYLHENLNLKKPKTFNEKLQWYKLNYCPKSDLIVSCTDKYQVKNYVKNKGLEAILTPLIGRWDSVEDICWESLPNSFVLKCTHGCAYNIICKDKSKFDVKLAKKKLKAWQKENFAAFNVELHYGKIKKHRIICEKYLGDLIIDYKFFCFNGNPKFFYVSSDLIHDRDAQMGFFSMDGEKIPLIRKDYKDIGKIKMPACFNEMINSARILSKDFPFVRVDFFLIKDIYLFAELTFTPGAAMMPINPRKYDFEWGEYWNMNR